MTDRRDRLTQSDRADGLREAIARRAADFGFDACGFTQAVLPAAAKEGLREFLAADHHGGMAWMAAHAARREDPQVLWPEAVSVISLGLSYAPAEDALAHLNDGVTGNISVYARGRDYHEVIKGRLKHVAQFVASVGGAEVKVFVDTAPVMEKPLAMQAGIGWQGKHTNLVSRTHGSWLLLGEIFTTLQIAADAPHADRCGSCQACLEICPTAAFPAPYKLDARRCLAYLTIEHAGPIPLEFRAAMGNRVFGCDDCLAVCPWNKFAVAAHDHLAQRADLSAPRLAELAFLTDAEFRTKFAGTPVKRSGRGRVARNVAIAIGNSGNPDLVPAALHLAADEDPVVAEAAGWALARLNG